VDWRVVLGVVLTLGAILGALAFWLSISDARAVVIATRDLPAGTILTADDLAVVQVRVDDAMYEADVPGTALNDLVGKALAEPAHAQQLLVRAQVSTRPLLGPDQVVLSIPVSPATAVGDQVRIGDAVEVILTTNKGKPDAQASVVLPRATVYAVGHDRAAANSGGGTSETVATGAVVWLALVVTPDQAIDVSRAMGAGELNVALLPPPTRAPEAGR
jgi:Flp pilus assembly protein CpaB